MSSAEEEPVVVLAVLSVAVLVAALVLVAVAVLVVGLALVAVASVAQDASNF